MARPCTKHKVRRAGFKRYPAAYLHQTLGLLHQTLGLVELPKLSPRFPWLPLELKGELERARISA